MVDALRDELKRTKREFTYSLGAQALWVVVVALIAMVNFFSIIDRSTIRVIGVAVNSLWMWMIPVTVGWVWVGTQNSANTVRDCLVRTSGSAVFLEDLSHRRVGVVGFQDCTWVNRDEQRVGRREWNRKDATTDLEAGAGLSPEHNRDETMVQPQGYIKPLFEGCMGESGPIFNFARFPRHLQMCSLVVRCLGT